METADDEVDRILNLLCERPEMYLRELMPLSLIRSVTALDRLNSIRRTIDGLPKPGLHYPALFVLEALKDDAEMLAWIHHMAKPSHLIAVVRAVRLGPAVMSWPWMYRNMTRWLRDAAPGSRWWCATTMVLAESEFPPRPHTPPEIRLSDDATPPDDEAGPHGLPDH